ARRLPLRHEVAVGGGRGTPVGAGRQLLRPGHEALLGRPCLGVALLEAGEEVPALTVESGAGVAEPLPQGVLGGAVDAWAAALRLLPLLEQGPQRLTGRPPLRLLRVLGGDLLGPFDDGG